MSVGVALSMLAALSQHVGAGPDNAPRRLGSSDLVGNRIALMSAVYDDLDENSDCQMYAPCVAVYEYDGSFYIPELCAGYSLTFDVDWDAREARIPCATLLVNDTILGAHASGVWPRAHTDTLRMVICASADYLMNGNETDLMGTVLDDGKVVFSFDRDDENDFQNGIVYYKEDVYLEYNQRGQLVSTDTVCMISPVISSLELLIPNAKHEFKQVFYVEGTNPIVEPDPDNSDPAGPGDHDFSDLIPGKPSDYIVNHGNTYLPDGVGGGHWGGPIKPIVDLPIVPGDFVVMADDTWRKNHSLDGSGNLPTLRAGTGNEGRGWGDLTPVSKSIEVDVTTEIYINQEGFGTSGRRVYIYNLFGNGRVDYFYVKEDGTFDFPFQAIEKDRNTGAWLFNYSTPTWNINELEEGNAGTATSDALMWSVTVPHDPNAPTDGGDNNDMERYVGKIDIIDVGHRLPLDLFIDRPYYYHSNHVYFTDGSSFVLSEPEVLNVSTVTRKIDAALRGEGSIADVTETINRLLKSTPGK